LTPAPLVSRALSVSLSRVRTRACSLYLSFPSPPLVTLSFLCDSRSVTHSHTLSLCLLFSLSRSLSLYSFISHALPLSLVRSHSLALSLDLLLSPFIARTLSLSHFLYLSLCLFLSVSLSFPLSPSLSLCHSLCLSLSIVSLLSLQNVRLAKMTLAQDSFYSELERGEQQ